MILTYGISEVGTSHISKGTPCQDSHAYSSLLNGWSVAVIADGVGSAKHSEVASRIACDTFVDFCNNQITSDTIFEDVLDIIRSAFSKADANIKACAIERGDSITDYDTTLSAVIYTGTKIAYGHSGDGGIIALTTAGEYKKVTLPQKAEDGVCVIPLRAGEQSWEIGFYNEDVVSVLLATDGVYDTFQPYLLRGQEVELYIPLVRWFMDNNIFNMNEENRPSIEESRKKFLCGAGCASITDDKTVVVAVNSSIMPATKDDAYYAEPDWNKLQVEWNKRAYPHLYKNNEDDEKSSKSNNDANDKNYDDEVDTNSGCNEAKSKDCAEVASDNVGELIDSKKSDSQIGQPSEPVSSEEKEEPKKKKCFFELFKKNKS